MNEKPQTTKIVLLAEDTVSDTALFRYAASVVGPALDLRFVTNGLEVVSYLKGDGDFANRKFFPLPDVLVLDMKMPLLDGSQVLSWLQTAEKFKDLKVFILTGSDTPDPVARLKGTQATLVRKPDDPNALIEFARGLLAYLQTPA